MNLVVVESPAKAKTINKYLGPDYTVLASYGHVRDLPSKDGSVLPDDDFAMSWEIDAKASKRLSEIAEVAKRSHRVILATDPDREGEAISWHVLEILTKKKVLKDTHVERVTFNAITKSAVLEAMAAPRQIDMELVEAYLARQLAPQHRREVEPDQIVQRALCGPGAVGRTAHRRRSRDGDRKVQGPGILVRRGRPERRQPALHCATGQTCRQAGAAS
jgi:5S rRNA maturation endonuclease (ribonuclease M5)